MGMIPLLKKLELGLCLYGIAQRNRAVLSVSLLVC